MTRHGGQNLIHGIDAVLIPGNLKEIQMKVQAFVTSVIDNAERSLTLRDDSTCSVFVFDDTRAIVTGTCVKHGENKFAALDKLKSIYADPGYKLRFWLA